MAGRTWSSGGLGLDSRAKLPRLWTGTMRGAALLKPVFGIALLAAMLLSPGRSAADFVPPKTLTIGLDDNYAPYSFRPEHGEVQGIMRDLWDLWSRRTGVAVRYQAIERSKRLAVLDSGLVDVTGYVVGTDSRAENYLMSPVPPVEVDVVIFFDRAISGIAGVESLEGFTIGVMGNGSCADFLAAHHILRLKVYPDWESLFTAAARREVTVFCSGRAAGIRRLYRMNLQAQFKLSPPLFTTPASWAVRKDDAALRDFIAAGFGLIRAEEREAIEARWLGTPVESSGTIRRCASWPGCCSRRRSARRCCSPGMPACAARWRPRPCASP